MASNKNQHFVPKCYLKPFTESTGGRAISLLNVERNRFIHGAPVKNQCSGDYFYGEDLGLERALQTVEGAYATALRRIVSPAYRLSDDDRVVLRMFWLLQYLRTEAASRRSVEMSNGLVQQGLAPTGYGMSIREAVQMAMGMYPEMVEEVSDLKVCLLRNRTLLPFVVCDDPAILTNRWHLQDGRARHRATGVGSAGALGFLPISPEILCVVYDGDVYSIPNQAGWADVRHESDVLAFNEHQFLNCRANIYFRDWPGCERLLSDLEWARPRRPRARHKLNVAVLDSSDGKHKRYAVVDDDMLPEGQEALIHVESVSPIPALWPTVIGWRSRGSVYTNNTALGFLRRARAARYGLLSFERLRIH